jgi:DNA-directed RNA polymerase subunit beta'
MTARNLERVIYYEDYMVIDPGETPLKQNQLLSEHGVPRGAETYGRRVRGQDGRRSVRERCASGPAKQIEQLQAGEMTETKSKQIRKKLAKRSSCSRVSAPRPVRSG